eukprot:1406769-Pleurochrysis_carterae.AAC.1
MAASLVKAQEAMAAHKDDAYSAKQARTARQRTRVNVTRLALKPRHCTFRPPLPSLLINPSLPPPSTAATLPCCAFPYLNPSLLPPSPTATTCLPTNLTARGCPHAAHSRCNTKTHPTRNPTQFSSSTPSLYPFLALPRALKLSRTISPTQTSVVL